jgi:hypothetical protein
LILTAGAFNDTAALKVGTLTLTLTITVTGHYNNLSTGAGNSYNPFARVTGRINGQGTQLTVVGVNGTTITSVNGTETITIAAGKTASFKVENTGAPAPPPCEAHSKPASTAATSRAATSPAPA